MQIFLSSPIHGHLKQIPMYQKKLDSRQLCYNLYSGGVSISPVLKL